MPTLKQLKAQLEKMVADGDRALNDFKAKLNQNPSHAFRWVDSPMSLVARQSVAQTFLNQINNWEKVRDEGGLGELADGAPKTEDEVVARIFATVTREAINKARWSAQSTSMGSNTMERQELAAYAELAADWDMIF